MPICTQCGSRSVEGARFCGNCGVPVSAVAIPNPPVGTGAQPPPRRMGRAGKFVLYFLLIIIGVTAAIWAFIYMAGTPASAPTTPSVQIPASEQSFISIVSAAQSQSRNVDNDMQRGGVKAARDHSLCAQMGSLGSLQVTDWVGTVDTVDSNSDGKGVLAVHIAPDITVTTWNNELSDIASDTLIEPGSPVFQAASAMKQGDLVRFSGSFLPGTWFFGGGGDCLQESSLTLKGKVESPDFIFRFSGISSYSAASTATTAETAQATPDNTAAVPAQQSTDVTPAPVASQQETPGSPSTPQTTEVTQGQTPDQVVAILGPPISITTGAKHVYTYPHVMIVFTDGKVSEIHQIH